ncbi:OmpA/MotB family protein [Clostridium chromiireducens]|uniref:OmpA/MotB family protein n=1 Tax=Clostridium chromiireducens TaxID=225345 RepID=UPI003AF934BB
MKIRSRRYGRTLEEPSYWSSFVDIMTTVTLVFFFIMIVSTAISSIFVDNIAQKRLELYKAIQDKLDSNKVDQNVIKFDDKEGKINIGTETFFDSGQWNLKQDGIDTANTIGNIFYQLLSDPSIQDQIQYIEIVGHTDYVGDTISNRRLSTERAMSFLNQLMPRDSELENKFGNKFKASGMSEFETNNTKELRDRTDDNGDETQRKIEIKMVFSNKDVENAVMERFIGKK